MKYRSAERMIGLARLTAFAWGVSPGPSLTTDAVVDSGSIRREQPDLFLVLRLYHQPEYRFRLLQSIYPFILPSGNVS